MTHVREPWLVRIYRRGTTVLGDLSSDAADAFAALYAEARRRGRLPALRLSARALADLAHAGVIAARPRPFASFGHDLRWSWRGVGARPGVSGGVVAAVGGALGAQTGALRGVEAFLLGPWGRGAAAPAG